MAAHANVTTSAAHEDHATPATYAKVGLILFVLTALEVGLYEGTYGESAGTLGMNLQPFFVPLLLLLSAAKFALVAAFYMHLKSDSKLLTSVFVFPIIIATVVILAVVALMAYHVTFANGG